MKIMYVCDFKNIVMLEDFGLVGFNMFYFVIKQGVIYYFILVF